MGSTNGSRRLTTKQGEFAYGFPTCETGAEAVLKAGYNTRHPDKIAYQLLENGRVREAIEARRRELREEVRIDQDTIVQGLYAIASDARQPGSSRVPAYMGIAKILGYVVDKRDVTGTIQHVLPPNSGLSIEELREARDVLVELRDRQTIEGRYRALPSSIY